MTNAIKWLFAVIISLIGTGCKDKNDDPKSIYDSERILECHNKQKWSIEDTKNKIIGLWEWKHAEYVYAIPPVNDKQLEELRIEFRDDGTGTFTNKTSTFEFHWSIGTYDVYYGFSTDPTIPQLGGQIFFCGDIMECGVGEFIDGISNYYEKLE